MQRPASIDYDLFSLFILILIMFYLVCNSFTFHKAWAISPFPRHEIVEASSWFAPLDPLRNTEWRQIPDANVSNITPLGNIESLSYYSDGKNLNATLWLSSPFEPRPQGHMPVYMMSIDADSNRETGHLGVDYRIRVYWNSTTQTWQRIFEEVSAVSGNIVLDKSFNHTGFFGKAGSFGELGERGYVRLSVDLAKINNPEQFLMTFTIHDRKIDKIYTLKALYNSRWIHIPPPKFIFTTSPNSVTLRPGEEGSVELQTKSTTNIESNVLLSTANTFGLQTNFIPDTIHIRPADTTTSLLKIKALDSATARPYTIIMYSNISFPTLDERGRYSFNFEKTDISQSFNLTANVLPTLTLEERLNNFYNVWFTPITGMYAVVSGIIVGSLPWILKKFRKKKSQSKGDVGHQKRP